ncbi:MAG: hypothetical protein AVDCRST_MAG68-2028 [uncultured Gemmatimonadetes bacterium]|uniref:Teneurin-like YD-shell domain-containing protein n=1 Tax=uncultured Gemmatimonadota bacterium TaxID=203437 RepID=A0A6J4L754_9BACT|nr:MAG: hypothetical protein AVDCRST_MAG68-2028 [uncultured Gemmatimonadota bacterium]
MRRTAPDGTVVRYLDDGDDLLAELRGAAGQTIREYTHFPGVDRPHSVRSWPNGGATYYYATDHPGHVVGLIDGTNQMAAEYHYTPWGEPESVRGTVVQPLRFMAREYEEHSGLYQVRARWYDAQQGRFVSEDPIGLAGGINPYVYAGNDPINNTDPTGLCYTVTITTYEVERRNSDDKIIRTTKIGSYSYEVGCHADGSGGGATGARRTAAGPEQAIPQRCGNAPPMPAGRGNGPYARTDSYMGISAVHMYQNGGNGPWAQRVRSCLACAVGAEEKTAQSMDAAHRFCYSQATNQVSGWESAKGLTTAV